MLRPRTAAESPTMLALRSVELITRLLQDLGRVDKFTCCGLNASGCSIVEQFASVYGWRWRLDGCGYFRV